MALDFKQIQELIRLVNKSNIGELIIEEKGFQITIKQKQEPAQQILTTPAQMHTVVSHPANPIPSQVQSSAQVNPQMEKAKQQEQAPSNTVTVKSPMIGTFYRSSTPGKPAFVEVGSEIELGTVVCIIEAMKLFNEIESEVKGKIVKILVEDASPVEYDQPLFLVDPA